MLVPVLLFIVGLLFLIKGGDWFVDGASALARRFHLPELLIGATVDVYKRQVIAGAHDAVGDDDIPAAIGVDTVIVGAAVIV